MSLTPAILEQMSFDHAVNALRLELGQDLAWLVDWIEAQHPDTDEEKILAAADNYGLDAADVDALGEAYFESITHTCAVLGVLAGEPGFDGTPEELQEGMLILRRLKKAGITTLGELEPLLESEP